MRVLFHWFIEAFGFRLLYLVTVSPTYLDRHKLLCCGWRVKPPEFRFIVDPCVDRIASRRLLLSLSVPYCVQYRMTVQ